MPTTNVKAETSLRLIEKWVIYLKIIVRVLCLSHHLLSCLCLVPLILQSIELQVVLILNSRPTFWNWRLIKAIKAGCKESSCWWREIWILTHSNIIIHLQLIHRSVGTLHDPTVYSKNLTSVGKLDSMNLGVVQTVYCINDHFAISFIFPAR